MNPFVLLLLQAGINIAKTHVSNATGNQILDTSSFILDAAKAVDDLYQEENGEPLDWTTIRHHQPLSPPGEPPAGSPPPGETSPDVPSSTGPEPEEVDSQEGEDS